MTLGGQIRNVVEVVTGVYQGDFTKKVTITAAGEVKTAADTANKLVDTLGVFSNNESNDDDNDARNGRGLSNRERKATEKTGTQFDRYARIDIMKKMREVTRSHQLDSKGREHRIVSAIEKRTL